MSDQTQLPTPPDPAPPDLGGLNPRDLIAGGLQSAVPRPQGWQPPEPEVLARLLPQYQIEAFLGRGGMGAVYRGRQIALDRAIALKLLPAELTADAEFVGRFQREARTLAKLQHPGIVAIYDFGQTPEGHLYFVMEYVDGTDLHQIIHGPGVNPAQALEIVAQVCEALQYAHTHGVMHRDIKPANVLLTQDGRAKLADFGLARPTHEDSGGFTRSNVVMGTPDYIAPEQMYGHADHRADLFSLGVMLYEMLTGHTPRGAWAPPSQRVRVDVRLDQVVIRALQHDVAMRYQQASEMKVDVDTIRTTPLPAAQPPPKKPQAAPPQKPAAAKPAAAHAPAPEKVAPVRRKKSSNSWLLATALALLAAGIGYWAATQPKTDTSREPPPSTAEPSNTGKVSARPAAPSAAPSPSPTLAAKAGIPKWQAVRPSEDDMKAKGLIALPGGWIDFNQRKTGPKGQNAWVLLNDKKNGWGNVAIRVRYKWQPGASLSLLARTSNGPGGRPTLTLWGNELKLQVSSLPAGVPVVAPPLVKPPAQLQYGQEGILELAVIGSRILARLDGKLVLDISQPGMAEQGRLEWRSEKAWLRDFEYLDLDAVADPLKALGWEVPASPIASSQQAAPANKVPAAATAPPVPAQWIDKTAQVMSTAIKTGGAEAVPGGWRPSRPKTTGAGLGPDVENGVIRFQHRGAAGAAVRLTDGKSYVGTVDAKVTLKFGDSSTTPGTDRILAENALPPSLKLADSHLTTFAFEGNRLRLWVDDVLVAEVTDTTLLQSGDIMVRAHAGTVIEKVEYGLLAPQPALQSIVASSSAPLSSAEASTAPQSASSGSTSLVIPSWFQQARQSGGKVRFFGAGPEGTTEKGRAEEFDDLVELRLRPQGWVVRRKNGEAHGVGFAKPSSTAPTGGRPVGPFQISFLGSGNITLMRSEPSGDYRNIFAGGSQHMPGFGVNGSSAFVSINDHVTTLGANGEILRSARWRGTEHLPPADLFRGAQAFAGFKESYLSAKPGQPVISWHVWDQKLTTFPAEISDVVEIHAVDHAVLRTASGKVYVTDQQGKAIATSYGQVPADLGPAIAVRAGRGMSAAQKADGTWVAWGDSPEMIEQTRKIGPALDVGYDVTNNGSKLMMWIEPSTAPALGGLAAAVPVPATPSGASTQPAPVAASELEARLADIHAKFQAAYDRDIAPPHAATVATLDNNYLAAVNRALNAATKRGDLDEAVQVRAEAKRVTDKQPMPAEDEETTPAILKTLRATYRATLASLEKERDAKAKPYFDRYDDLLGDYQKELTQQGKLDDALAVKTRRDELREKGAASTPAKAPSPSPETAATAPAIPATPDAASQDKLLDWVFGRKGEVTVRVGTKLSKAKTRNELPNQPYEMREIQVTGPGIGDREVALISASPSLKVVRLLGKNEFKTLKPFATLTSLGQLSIQGTPIKEGELVHLAGLTALDSIYLEFSECTGEGFTALHAHDKLKSINLINVDLSAAGAQAIAGISSLSNITLDRFVQRKSQAHLAAFAALPNLTLLSLAHCRLGEEAFKAIATFKTLTHLNLSDSEFDNAGFAHLAPLGPTLTSLTMHYGATVSDEGIRHIVANLPNLETISASTGATCTGDSIRELAKLPKLKNISWWVKGMKAKDYQLLADLPAIERITLHATAITDDSLSVFPKSQTLIFLNLDDTAITDKGLAHLQAIPHLTELVLRSTKVTAAGFAAFEKARPEVKVTK